ncbi:MAG: DUF2299 domain-containing protein [Promethearchaeota archaeon]|nr:MAG: DUF2299 domain-containing protein [Candidatus Lokiarchaeota archaeon]
MSSKESKIKTVIREYLLDEGILRENIKDPRLEFGFKFEFPPGKDPSGRPIGKPFTVAKLKKKDRLDISINIGIDPKTVKMLESRKTELFNDLKKLFLSMHVMYSIDVNNNRYNLIDIIYLDNNNLISKNTFYKSVRILHDAAIHSFIIIGEYVKGEHDGLDFVFPDK